MTEKTVPDREALLLSELRDVGITTSSLTMLRGSGQRYPTAVPIMLRWLSTGDLLLKEQIVRALSFPWAKQALPALIQEFRTLPLQGKGLRESVRWAIGNAIEVMWDDAYFDELASIASDREYGSAREMIVLGLGKSKKPQAIDLLLALLADDEVNGHATSSLAKLAPVEATPGLERMLTDKRAWVRKDAKRGLAKIHKHHAQTLSR